MELRQDMILTKDAAAGPLLMELAHFSLIRFSGEDAQPFLHAQLSCDVKALGVGRAQYGGYSTPQGRMLATFLLWRDDAGYVMQLPHALAEPIRKRLSMYILRSKVRAVDASGEFALLGVSGAGADALLRPLCPQLPAADLMLAQSAGATVLRLAADRFEIIALPERAKELREVLAAESAPAGHTVWEWLDIRAGIPYVTPATQDQFVLQMANLDLIGGVSYTKGCYPGQEIVARTHYLGRLKQRMYLAHIAAGEPPLPGDKLYSATFGDQACGAVMNAAPAPGGGHDVLAVMQIASAAGDEVHLKSRAGAKLSFLKLPYEVG